MPSCPMCAPTAVLPSACATGKQHQQAWHLLRAVRRHAIVPEVFTYSSAAIGVYDGHAAPAGIASLSSNMALCNCARCIHLQQCRHQHARRASSARRRYVACARCDAMPSRRMQSPNELPSAWAKVPAALADLTSPTCGAGPCHCAGCSHLQRCYRREQKWQQHKQALPLSLVRPCHAIVPDVVSYSAAMRPAAPAGATSRTRDASPCHCTGCSHLQCCHQLGQKCQQH